jgi:hypothetical protein
VPKPQKSLLFATEYLQKLLETSEFFLFLRATEMHNQFSDEQSSHPAAAPRNLSLGL